MIEHEMIKTNTKIRKINAKLISICNRNGLHGISRQLRTENKWLSSYDGFVAKKYIQMRKWHLFEKRLEFKP